MSATTSLTDLAALAAADQAAAREREFERRVRPYLLAFLVAAALFGAYAFLAAAGHAPVAPWSPLGQAQQVNEQPGHLIAPGAPDVPDTGTPSAEAGPDTTRAT